MTTPAPDPGTTKASKNIVICLDGTGNQVGTRNHPTNGVKLYEMLDLSDPAKQIGYYDPGVGTISAANARSIVAAGGRAYAGLPSGQGSRPTSPRPTRT